MSLIVPAALSVLALTGQAEPQISRPEVAVVVVPLDRARQGQIRYGRGLVDEQGGERGGFTFVEPTVVPLHFRECWNSTREDVEHCMRHNLGALGVAGQPAPTVLVVLDDLASDASVRRGPFELQASCFGPGAAGTDPEAQTVRLWPEAWLMGEASELEGDERALAACIRAAAAETPINRRGGW